jgi:hypothetical protein
MFNPRTFLRIAPLLWCSAALAQTPPAAPPPAVPAVPATAAPVKKPAKSEWVFSLLPKSFQKNPKVDLTVITEMTEAGKKLPVASPTAPVYYFAQSGGYHQMGETSAGEHTLKPEDVERLLKRALATNGFLPATREHPPTLAIFYTWGSHNLLIDDPDNSTLTADQVARNLLDRAALVGGAKFAEQMLKLFHEADDMAMLNNTSVSPVLGAAQMDFLNPINRFKEADPKNDALFEQFTNDVYYVVASAYDYSSLTKKERLLYWRTRMTVAAQGVSQEQTLPTLIVSAAPFFGKEMSEPEILTKRAVPDGQVEIGTPTVVDLPATSDETKARKP